MLNDRIYNSIDKLLTILENNFKYDFGKKIPMNEVFEMTKNIHTLINNYQKNRKECGEICIRRFIPLLDL